VALAAAPPEAAGRWRGWPGRLLLALCLTLLAACASSGRPGGGAAIRPQPPPAHTVAVLVPGVTGTILLDAASDRVTWGNGKSLLLPHDGAYAMAQPIPPAGPDGPATPPLRLGPVLDRVRLGPLRKEVYGKLLDTLAAAGWHRGSLVHPEEGGDLFAFAYDWRQDNVVSAQRLAERLEALRRARGETTLRVQLLCQSNGAHICRYLAKYGGATLAAAEAGQTAHPAGIEIDRLLLIGTSNGGSLRILRELDRGRSYVPWIGRRMQPEVLFTLRSLYQDLPVYRQDLFLDGNGRDLALDLFDPDTWITHRWSIFAPRTERRADRRPDLFGDRAERRAFLADALDRAQRFHRLLHADPAGYQAPEIYLLQNAFEPTPDRAVVLESPRRGHPLAFTGDREVDAKPYLAARARAPGDGHAAVASQLYLSPAETAALAAEPFYVPGGHFEMILEPAMLQRIVEILRSAP
jgi:hypothetical protein